MGLMPPPQLPGDGADQPELFELRTEDRPRKTRKRRKKKFFAVREPHSAVKAEIASEYFPVYAKILIGSGRPRILYLDFFCGPGKYEDDSESTPLLVLRKIIEAPELRERVVTFFGDQDKDATKNLQALIDELPGIDTLKNKPIVRAGVVTAALQSELAELKLVPTMMFLDPFGYKVVNVDIIRAIIKNPSSECLFFFNYNRVMPAITNPGVRHLVDAIFGPTRVQRLQESFDALDDAGKEALVVQALRDSMQEIGGKFTLPFRFKKDGRTTHHLVFVGTNKLGHKIMKELMGKRSSDHYQDVPSFEFREGPIATEMFQEPRPIDDLKADLLKRFAGRSSTITAIFEEHNVGTRYVMKNYKEAIKQLMREGRIPEGERGRDRPKLVAPYRTMPDDVLIAFPAGS
jgi:three-Cys-motif partner protein